MIKKYLAAANTPRGFVSFFETAIAEHEMEKVFFIKGGPGTGKSTFMRKVGKAAEEKGLSALELPCSSDVESIDILVVPELKTILVDATNPHMLDPKYPGLIGETLDFASFLDKDKLLPQKQQIMSLFKQKTMFYKLVYKYLNAAEILNSAVSEIAADALNPNFIENVAFEIYGDFLYKQLPLRPRKGFMDYLQTDGYASLFDTVEAEKNIGIKCSYDLGIWEFFRFLFKKIEQTVHLYFDVANPDKLAHITVGNINVVSNVNPICDYQYNLDGAFSEKSLKQFESELVYLKKNHDVLIKNAGVQLENAKAAHGELETLYGAAMDFDGLENMHGHIIDKIFR